ncbi:uncharacterized protein DUF2752 [Natranaerovirga hydrolytica]|uniref:Uncharacterized protein DUF2752 n=1 Tax=Natranaerovirga hydrolytica TaxID=680378 RepID=A0A4R1MDG3_9FIRM|nr:uncharacterized protein DUF2752 [Natranaerovirga hydrolytica]
MLLILGFIGIISLISTFFWDKSLCLIYNTTGMPCPSCGMTRAFRHLIALDFRSAFMYHPLFVVPLLIPFIYIKNIYNNSKLLNRLIGITIVIIIITWGIRLFMFFPHSEPFLFNSDAIIPSVYNHLTQ